MSESITCCFKGCPTVVWAPAPTDLKVICSSATCIQCKQMVFCLEHFTELYQGHSRYECPHCSETQWWVAQFEPSQLEPGLVTEVQRQGGLVEDQFVATESVAEGSSAVEDVVEAMEPESREASTDPALEAWRLMRNADLPPGFAFLGPGIATRRHTQGMDLIANKATFELPPRQHDYTRAACSRSGKRLVLQTRDHDGHPILICHDAAHREPVTLRTSPTRKLGAVMFIDEVRFAYLVLGPSQKTALYEGSFDGPRRIRSRRITDLGAIPEGPGLLAISQRRELLITGRRHANHFQIIGVRLADSKITPIAELGARPRQLVAAENAQTVAWISLDGEIRHGAIGTRDRLIGRTDENLLALSDNGELLAWVHGNRLEAANLKDGTIHQRPVRPGVIQISAL